MIEITVQIKIKTIFYIKINRLLKDRLHIELIIPAYGCSIIKAMHMLSMQQQSITLQDAILRHKEPKC